MTEFFKFSLAQPLTASAVLAALRALFADFAWRQGDSDMQGPYVWGRSDDGVRMTLWLGEETPVLTISFSSFEPEAADRGVRIDARLRAIKETFSTEITPIAGTHKPVVSVAAE